MPTKELSGKAYVFVLLYEIKTRIEIDEQTQMI